MDLDRRDLMTAAGALAVTAAASPVLAQTDVVRAPPETWVLTDLYPTAVAWNAEREAVLKALPVLAGYKDKLGTDAATLRTALRAMSDTQKRVARLNVYAGLIADSDTSAAAAQERRQLAIALYGQFSEAVAYVQPEVLAIGADKVAAFQKADRGLSAFAFELKDIFRKAPFTLTAESEGVIAAAGTPLAGAQQIRTQLVNSDLPWPEVTLTTGKVRLDDAAYTSAREAPNRDDRKKVFESFFGAYGQFKSSLATALSTQVQSNIFVAKAHRHANALEGALSDAGAVPPGVYRTLVDETNRGLPQLHRYFDVRRRLLGLPDMHYYDIYPPLVRSNIKYSLADIRRLTLEAVAPLGEDYVDTLARATASPWADYRPRKNKVSGAYMNGDAYDVHPFLLLNLTDNYESLTTFAHEWGHAMHTVLANKAQAYETAAYPIFTAEIASTMNEQLLIAHMLKGAKTTRDEKVFYLGQLLEQLRGTFFRQAMFAEFELQIHETVEKGGALSGEGLNTMYMELLKKYYGPKVIIDPVVAAEWAYIPHFYYDFYVYQYATSIAASAYFAEQVPKGSKQRENYLSVLRAGGSDYPVNVLRKAGLDMTTPAPYSALIEKFAKTLDQIEALI